MVFTTPRNVGQVKTDAHEKGRACILLGDLRVEDTLSGMLSEMLLREREGMRSHRKPDK